jgi:hypothetical protein
MNGWMGKQSFLAWQERRFSDKGENKRINQLHFTVKKKTDTPLRPAEWGSVKAIGFEARGETSPQIISYTAMIYYWRLFTYLIFIL